MSYSQFTNLKLKEQFGVEQQFKLGLFSNIVSRQPSVLLKTILAKQIPFALAQGSEKARSEYIIAPVFFELREQTEEKISIFSGVRLDVDRKQKLDGWCDFLVSRSSYQFALEAPVVVVVEAKKDDFEQGITQCIAEMLAARIYNTQHKVSTHLMYGCVTTGDIWRFLLLKENKVWIETEIFDIQKDLSKIIGILWAMSFDEVIFLDEN